MLKQPADPALSGSGGTRCACPISHRFAGAKVPYMPPALLFNTEVCY